MEPQWCYGDAEDERNWRRGEEAQCRARAMLHEGECDPDDGPAIISDGGIRKVIGGILGWLDRWLNGT